MNPLNQLPTSAEWMRKCEAAAKRAAEDTGSSVVLVVLQENGKMAVISSGEPDTGPLAEAMAHMPSFLASIAFTCGLNEQYENEATRS
jgi:hypothetical protein